MNAFRFLRAFRNFRYVHFTPILGLCALNIDPQEDSFLIKMRNGEENEIQQYAFFEYGITYLQFAKEEIVRNLWYNRYHTLTQTQEDQLSKSTKCFDNWFQQKIDKKMKKNQNKYNEIGLEMQESIKTYKQSGQPFKISSKLNSWWKFLEFLELPTSNIFGILYATKLISVLQLNDNDNISILDIGCGTGLLGEYLTKYILNKNITLIGIDGSDYVLNEINSKYKYNDNYAHIFNYNICNPEFEHLQITNQDTNENTKFDIVISLELLYQTATDGLPGIKGIKDCMEFIKNDGYFITINGLHKTHFVNYIVMDDCLEDYLKENDIKCIVDDVIIYNKQNGDSIHHILDNKIKIDGIDLNDYDCDYTALVVRVYHKQK